MGGEGGGGGGGLGTKENLGTWVPRINLTFNAT